MSNESIENVIDLSVERSKRIHDLNEKRLQNVRSAFINVLPLAKKKNTANRKAKEPLNNPAQASRFT